MATVRDIERLFKKVNVTIDESDVLLASSWENNLETAKNLEEYLIKNAEKIDFKKLLLITVKRLQELTYMYKEQKISKLLEDNNQKELDKAIEFAKLYIKPDEVIKFFITDSKENSIEIYSSKEIIYGQKFKNENKKYDETKKLFPNVAVEEAQKLLEEILDDKTFGRYIYVVLIGATLKEQGYSDKEIYNILKLGDEKLEGRLKETLRVIDEEIFNAHLKGELDDIKKFINTDKYILFHTHILNKKLEKQEELSEKEIEFLENLEELLQEIKKNEKFKSNDKSSFKKEDAEKFMLKLNKETWEYCTEEQLKTGEKLLRDTNGYENYLSKDKLRELAKIEENLIYLAQTKKLSAGNINTIVRNNQISESTIVELYNCGVMTLNQVERCSQEKGINIDELKEKIKQSKFKNINDIDINNEETWELLTQEERLKVIIEKINNEDEETLKQLGNEKLEQLYNIDEIANLYKEIYEKENTEKRERYKDLIKIYNVLGKEKNDEIVTLLEDEFSNEMLINLYSDNLIDIDILESYGEKELVIETFEQGKIHEKDVIDLYVDDKIKLEAVKKFNETLSEDKKIEKYLSEDDFINLYKNTKNKNNQEDIIKYKRYKLLYQTLKREKTELDNKLVNNSKDFLEEDIIELYKDNMLTLEAVSEYGGAELIKKLTIEGALKPSDAKSYFDSEKEDLKIEEILKNPNMDDTEKIILIYSTYDDNKEKREYFVNYLQAHTTDIKGEETGERKQADKKEKNSTKQTVTDPYERWRLFNLLDKNYTKKYVGGYLVINLNNTQKTIVEKMYQKKDSKVVPAYGTATFVVDTEEYLKIEDELLTVKRFNIAKLRKIAKESPEIISKITHHPPVFDEEGKEKNSWTKRLLEKTCEENIEDVYTVEEIEQIKKCGRDIEKSRQELAR